MAPAFERIYVGAENIGDMLFMEPALRAQARLLGKPVKVFAAGIGRTMFEQNSAIELVDVPSLPQYLPRTGIPMQILQDVSGDIWYKIDIAQASWWSTLAGQYITMGIFAQLGFFQGGQQALASAAKLEISPKLNLGPDRYASLPTVEDTYLCIAPFSNSCTSKSNQVANKMTTISWWERIATRSTLPVISLWELGDPEVRGTVNLRGISFKEVLDVLNRAKAIATVETAFLPIAEALDIPTIFLHSQSASPQWLVCSPTAKQTTVVSSVVPQWDFDQVSKILLNIVT